MSEQYELVLCHHGIQGQKWGIRRYQDKDGRLTSEGRERLGLDKLGENGKNIEGLSNRKKKQAYRKERAQLYSTLKKNKNWEETDIIDEADLRYYKKTKNTGKYNADDTDEKFLTKEFHKLEKATKEGKRVVDEYLLEKYGSKIVHKTLSPEEERAKKLSIGLLSSFSAMLAVPVVMLILEEY